MLYSECNEASKTSPTPGTKILNPPAAGRFLGGRDGKERIISSPHPEGPAAAPVGF